MIRRLRHILVTVVFSSSPLLLAHTAVEPVPRDSGWMERHERFLEIARAGEVDLLFLGDSITQGWGGDAGRQTWETRFAPLGAANFGISGDRTQHVLWRIENGELDGIEPKVVVLMIGTNNTGFESDGATPRNSVPEIVDGVTAIVRRLREKLPQSEILLLAVFPRGEKPDHPQRRQVNAINQELAKLHDGRQVHFLDIGEEFLAADGTLPPAIMPDFLHLSAEGYRIWADAIAAPLSRLLGRPIPEATATAPAARG